VAVSAQADDQPRVAASTTLPGAPEGGAPEAQAVAEQAAASVSQEIDATVTAVAVMEPDAPAAEPALELSLDAVQETWPGVADQLEAEFPMLAAALREARPTALADRGLTLAWPQSAGLSKKTAEDPSKREVIARSIQAVTGASLRLAFELRADEEIERETEPVSEEELVDRFKREFSAVEEPPPSEET
jgi:hypothetical protein